MKTLDMMNITIDTASYFEIQVAVGQAETSESAENILMKYQVNYGLKYFSSLGLISTKELAFSLVFNLIFENFFSDIQQNFFSAYEF